jgi:SAM-dependent methyltransferase
MFNPVIPADVRPYLEVQQGALWDLRGDRKAWDAAYALALHQRFELLEPWLPSGGLHKILDVGGGMGGFPALLARHYGGGEITILDGFNDPPTCVRHDQTFSSCLRAGAFLAANGVRSAKFIDAARMPEPIADSFDLVLSQQAWGFHFAPALYLKWVMESCENGAILAIDLRREANHWAVTLFSQHHLEPLTEIDPHPESKFTIGVFQVDRGGKSQR